MEGSTSKNSLLSQKVKESHSKMQVRELFCSNCRTNARLEKVIQLSNTRHQSGGGESIKFKGAIPRQRMAKANI